MNTQIAIPDNDPQALRGQLEQRVACILEEAARQGMDGRARLVAAAAWFQERGESHAAVRHALLAEDVDLAARIVESEGGWRLVYLTARGGAAIFRAMIEKAAQIDLQDYPLTTLGFAVTSVKAGHLEAANHYLGLVEAMAHPTPEIERQLRVVRALHDIADPADPAGMLMATMIAEGGEERIMLLLAHDDRIAPAALDSASRAVAALVRPAGREG